MNSILLCLRQYADFKGRTPRKTFWVFLSSTQVFLTLLCVPLIVVYWQYFVDGFVTNERIMTYICSAEEPMTDAGLDQEIQTLVESCAEQVMAGSLVPMVLAGVACLLGLFLVIPTLAVTVRRVRDAGQSPLWVWVACLSMVGWFASPDGTLAIDYLLGGVASIGGIANLVVLVFCFLPSVPAGPTTTGSGEPDLPPLPPAP